MLEVLGYIIFYGVSLFLLIWVIRILFFFAVALNIPTMIQECFYIIRAFVYKWAFTPGSILNSKDPFFYSRNSGILVLPNRTLYTIGSIEYGNYEEFSFYYDRKIGRNELLLLAVREKNENIREQLKILLKRIL